MRWPVRHLPFAALATALAAVAALLTRPIRSVAAAPTDPVLTSSLEIIGGLWMIGVPLYFVLQVWLGFRWTGGWRIAALMPLAPIGPAILWSLYALSHQSNLWPITVVLLAPLGSIYLLIVWMLHAIVRS
jgi:hypothetical protein